MALDSKQYDVAIVGAGPAGSSAAIRLALAGQRVLLVEQKRFPREKLCGEFISPECLSHFAELGVSDEIGSAGGADLTETVFFGRNGKSVSVESDWFGDSDSLALGLSRAEMDLKLLRRATDVGVDVVEDTTVSGTIVENGAVIGIKLRSKDVPERNVSANLVIDATGRTRSLARQFAADSEKHAAKHVAFKTHLRGATISPGKCEIYVYRGGYGGCNRVEDDLYNLCFIAASDDVKRLGSDPERIMREIVFTNRRASEAMQDVVVSKPWLAVPIQRFGRGELVPARGLLTIGDAAAFIDPFTGSGMLLALQSAKIAASAIIGSHRTNSDFSTLAAEYQNAYAAAFDRRLRVCSLLRNVAFIPSLAEMTIALLGLSTPFRRRLARATRFSAGSVS